MRGFITLNNCIPYSKNPKIAKIFREIGLADELGSGVRNITNYSKVYSGDEPIFEDGEIFKAKVPLVKVLNEMKVNEVNKMTVKEFNEALVYSNKAPVEALDKAPVETLDKIIIYCEEPKTAIQIMNYLGYKNIKRFRRDYIKPLVEKGILKMTIPDKPTSRNQKYISLKG